MTIANTVQNSLIQHSIEYKLVSHPHTESSHETANAAHVSDDHIAKAVILRDTTGYAMVVIPASNRVKIEHLHKELCRDFELATEDEIASLFTDCETGAIPPLGPAYGIETFLDKAFTSLANVYFEAGDHSELVHTNGKDFLTLLGGVRQGYYSHDD